MKQWQKPRTRYLPRATQIKKRKGGGCVTDSGLRHALVIDRCEDAVQSTTWQAQLHAHHTTRDPRTHVALQLFLPQSPTLPPFPSRLQTNRSCTLGSPSSHLLSFQVIDSNRLSSISASAVRSPLDACRNGSCRLLGCPHLAQRGHALPASVAPRKRSVLRCIDSTQSSNNTFDSSQGCTCCGEQAPTRDRGCRGGVGLSRWGCIEYSQCTTREATCGHKLLQDASTHKTRIGLVVSGQQVKLAQK